MTINEAIEREKFKARIDRIKANKRIFHNNDEDEINACNRSAEEHEQIAEWLEELKELRTTSCGYSKEDIELNRNAMYDKAIDDFAILIKETLSHDWATTKISEQIIYNGLFDKCNEISEQLKERDVK